MVSTAQQLTSWAHKAREATVRRDALIVQRRAEGASLRQIASEANLSHTAIAKVLASQAEA